MPAPERERRAAAGTPGSPTLWVGTAAGVSRLVPGSPDSAGPRWQTHTPAPLYPLHPAHAPLPAAHVTALAAAPGGEVWVATHGGLARYRESGDPGGEARWRTATVENAGLPYPTVLGLAVDRHGVAWAATGAGAAMIDLDAGPARSGRSRAFTGANAPLMHQLMDAAYVDSGGRVWFGSAGGVNVYRPDAPGTLSAPGTPETNGAGDGGEWVTGFNRISTAGGLPDNQVYTVLGRQQGTDLVRHRRRRRRPHPGPHRIRIGRLRAVALDDPHPPWRPARRGRGARHRGGRPGAPLLRHQERDLRAGRIPAGPRPALAPAPIPPSRGGAAGGSSGGLPHPWVQALVVGPDGRLWAGTRGGLAVIDPDRPEAGWQSFRAHPLGRWVGFLWPPLWQGHIVSDDVTSLLFSR